MSKLTEEDLIVSLSADCALMFPWRRSLHTCRNSHPELKREWEGGVYILWNPTSCSNMKDKICVTLTPRHTQAHTLQCKQTARTFTLKGTNTPHRHALHLKGKSKYSHAQMHFHTSTHFSLHTYTQAKPQVPSPFAHCSLCSFSHHSWSIIPVSLTEYIFNRQQDSWKKAKERTEERGRGMKEKQSVLD